MHMYVYMHTHTEQAGPSNGLNMRHECVLTFINAYVYADESEEKDMTQYVVTRWYRAVSFSVCM